MTEAELEEEIRAQCKARRILYFHVRHSIGMNPGFVDDVLIGRAGLLWRENKSESGTLSHDQRIVRDALRALGQNWALWRPSDLRSGLIARQLGQISGIQGELWRAS